MLAAIPTESKELNIKIEIQEQMVPSAGFSPQSDPYESDYMHTFSEQSFGVAQGLNTPQPNEATSAYCNLADTFDLSLLGDDHDMATVPSPSWSPAFSMEPPSWQQVSFYAASPNGGNGYDIKPVMSPEGLYTNTPVYSPASPATSINSQASMISDPMENKNMLLRQCLADTSFQKKYNFKPLDLPSSSLFVEPSVLGQDLASTCNNTTLELNQIEPVFSMAFAQFRNDIQSACSSMAISPDPSLWSGQDVQKWLAHTIVACLPANNIGMNKVLGKFWNFDGPALCALTEESFNLLEPECGYMIFHQLELWKMLRTKNCGETQNTPDVSFSTADFDMEQIFNSPYVPSPLQPTTVSENFEEPPSVISDVVPTMVSSPSSSYSSPAETELMTTDGTDEEDDEEEEEKPSGKGKSGQKNGAHIHLWQFLKELLATPQQHGSCIRWLDQPRGVFKIEDSVKVARLWGLRKNRPAMNYDKLSRSIRQYYKKGIMKKTERSQRLVYQFCHPYGLQ